jgi:uncharacterized membrane protein
MKQLRNLNLKSDKNGYAVAVALSLLIASILLGVYYVAPRADPDGYMTIYVLDSQKKANSYPELLVAGENSTFSVYVEVENHMGNTIDFQVQLKVTSDMNPTFPVYGVEPKETFNGTIKDEGMWENIATVSSLNHAGNYMVIFELWILNEKGVLQFSQDLCVLNVQVL